MLKDNNKGFTLIEMIVTLAVMAVLMVIMGYSISILTNSRAKGCADDLYTAIQGARTEAMAKDGEISLIITAKDDGIYVKLNTGNENKIGGSRLTVLTNYDELTDTGNALVPGGSNASYEIQFDKKTGGFKSDYGTIMIQGSANYKLTLYKLTGKVTVEKQ